MRTTRTSFPHILLTLIAVALLLCAQPVAHADDGAFEGVVVEDGVKVRAGAGRTFYIVGSLKKGATVKVDEVIFGWNKIAAPSEVYSYISKAFVDAQGNGTTGTVNRNDAPVNAASLEGPGDSYRHQLDLDKGDPVKIVGEEGSFYKVIAPALQGKKRAFVYLPPGSVQKATVAVPEPPKPSPVVTPPTPKPIPFVTPPAPPKTNETNPTTDVKVTTPKVSPPATGNETGVDTGVKTGTPNTKIELPDIKVDLPKTPDTKTDVPAVIPTSDPVVTPVKPDITLEKKTINVPTPASGQTFSFENKQLQAIEATMVESLKLSLEDQPIDALMTAFHAYLGDASLSAKDEYYLQARVYQLKRNGELAKALIALKRARENITPDPDITLAAPVTDETTLGAARRYDATGQLQTSGVYDGINLPRLLRLVDPTTKRTIAYVRPSGKVDTDRSLGRMVGIQGKTNLDRALNLNIIDVKTLDVLEAVNSDTTNSSASALPASE